jgi:Holliday junction resolvase RusA-like endonuclease
MHISSMIVYILWLSWSIFSLVGRCESFHVSRPLSQLTLGLAATKKTPSETVKSASKATRAKAKADDKDCPYKLSKEMVTDGIAGDARKADFFARVIGEPRPLLRHRLSRGCVYNPSCMYQKSFWEACTPVLPVEPLTGPLEAQLTFHFQRPLAHFSIKSKFKPENMLPQDRILEGKLHSLRNDAPRAHTTRKDLDNLIKFVLDALNGKAYVDDCQITSIVAKKKYSDKLIPMVDVAIIKLDSL